jgi:hypothetical protein
MDALRQSLKQSPQKAAAKEPARKRGKAEAQKVATRKRRSA